MISIKVKGDYKKTEKYLKRVKKLTLDEYLDAAGMLGVIALSANTPIDTGATASSWNYEIHRSSGEIELVWTNSHMTESNPYIPVAILIQYGHATRNGGYVVGRDFINPAIQPIFDQLAKDIWTEVTRE